MSTVATSENDAVTAPNLVPAAESSVWHQETLAQDPSWRHRLTEGEVAEILAATRAVEARGLAACEFGKDDFPLPTLVRGSRRWSMAWKTVVV